MGIEGYYEDYFDDRQEDEKLTNFQKIKNMSLEEMASYLPIAGEYCEVCLFRYSPLCTEKTEDMDCTRTIKKWLQEESEV